ncbi:Glycoside hydrolase, family 28 [Dillenia turbinata]|uniref:Glycoside hydrolase, family 28 n=1 Tax=Dillenia turbinata TaxID=194707 RepID=A0AAN8VII4_9MAGN
MSKLILVCYVIFLHLVTLVQSSNAVYNVVSYGAKSDGKTDSTKAFLKAWASACASVKSSTLYVPRGTFLMKAVVFKGPCKNKITVQIDGSIVAPSEYRALGTSGFWILFFKVDRVSVYGGTLDAKGAAFWACRTSGKSCPPGARSITFMSSTNVVVSGLRSINGELSHMGVNGCTNVLIRNVKLIAPDLSPNTDGIHVQYSTGVTITGCNIQTGDDCISIGPGTRNMNMDHIACGPGHGISIGSLGWSVKEEGVQNISLTNSIFTGSDNGVRIKTWARASNGFVRNVAYKNIVMKNVDNPIIIDQNYCPTAQGCPKQGSGVKISGVTYSDIRGTSGTQVAVKLDCSPTNPCTDIRLHNIKLTHVSSKITATSFCKNAGGKSTGILIPASCL